MKKNLLLNIAIIAFAVLTSLTSLRAIQADIVFSIDVDPDLPGIQDMRTLVNASTFQATLLLELTGTTTVDSYRTSVQFDGAAIKYQSGSGTATPLVNYSPQVGNLFLTFDTIGPFEASANIIGNGSVAPIGPFVIGSFSFTAQNTAGSFVIKPIEVAFLDGSFDNNFNQLNPVFNGATITITAVPEPSTLSIIGVAVCSCYLVRRVRNFRGPTVESLKGKL